MIPVEKAGKYSGYTNCMHVQLGSGSSFACAHTCDVNGVALFVHKGMKIAKL
jgi:hypothetical protein